MRLFQRFMFAILATSTLAMAATTQEEARAKLRADLERVAQDPSGQAAVVASVYGNPAYTDAAQSAVIHFIATLGEPDPAKRKAAQDEVLSKLGSVDILTPYGLGNGDGSQTPVPAAVPAPKVGEPVSPADAANRPANRPTDLKVSETFLFNERDPLDERYTMPAELTEADAQALIRDTEYLAKRLPELPKVIDAHYEAIVRCVNPTVKDKLWSRLVSGKGFKDATIGEAWYELAIEYDGFVNVIEHLLKAGGDYAGVAAASVKLQGVRMRLIGGRVTWGDEAFVRVLTGWVEARIAKLENMRKRADALRARLVEEGVVGESR
jgi:hypothetical protein